MIATNRLVSGPVQASPLARRLLLHLVSIGRGMLHAKAHVPPLKKPGACVYWVTSGRGILKMGDMEIEVKPGPFFWIYNSERARVFTPASSWGIYTQAFWFAGPGYESWLEELDVKRRPQIRPRHPARIYRAYQEMCRLVQRLPSDWELKVHLLISSILGELLSARKSWNAEGQELPATVRKALDEVEIHPDRDWKPRQMAVIAGLSYSTFAALFRKNMHESPHAYLQRVRVDMAREMMANPGLRIKEIAQRLHFSSGHYFSNFFHQHTGTTPTEFRRRLGWKQMKG